MISFSMEALLWVFLPLKVRCAARHWRQGPSNDSSAFPKQICLLVLGAPLSYLPIVIIMNSFISICPATFM